MSLLDRIHSFVFSRYDRMIVKMEREEEFEYLVWAIICIIGLALALIAISASEPYFGMGQNPMEWK
jgi:hypothetical protein